MRNEILRGFGRIARQRTLGRVIAESLQVVHETLGFERVVFLTADSGTIQPQCILDDGERVQATSATLSPAAQASFEAAKAHGVVSGAATDLWTPLIGPRRRYLLSALRHDATTYGFLYLDGPSDEASAEGEIDLLVSLTSITAVASRNALLIAHIEQLASRDPLTGLLNRRALAERLRQALDDCRRQGTSLTYLLIDIDDFKYTNDSAGHAAGDALLASLADDLLRLSRAGDIVARLGGDEFVMIIPSASVSCAAANVASVSERLHQKGLRCSLGAAVYPRDGLDAATLARAADRALYAAKARGKGHFLFA